MSTKRTRTPEQLQRAAAYLRRYRHANPDRVRQWRDNYTLRRAERLRAEAEANQSGGGDRGGN